MWTDLKEGKKFPEQVAGKIFEAKEKDLGDLRVANDVKWRLCTVHPFKPLSFLVPESCPTL